MSDELLHHAQVAGGAGDTGGEEMTQRVRRCGDGETSGFTKRFDQALHVAGMKAVVHAIDQQRRRGRGGERHAAG